ncbi:hypothetical protein ACQJBY_036474 [Aegilops geniculata]
MQTQTIFPQRGRHFRYLMSERGGKLENRRPTLTEFPMQPIRRSTLIEEVGESLLPEGSLADGDGGVVSGQHECERGWADLRGISAPAAMSEDGRICSMTAV